MATTIRDRLISAARFWPFIVCIPFVYLLVSGMFVPIPVTRSDAIETNAGLNNVEPTNTTYLSDERPWRYDFSVMPDGSIDQTLWLVESGTLVASYNNEAQAYTNRTKNVRVQDGELLIEAHRESYMNRGFTSARISTKDYFAFTYGTLEVTMKLPKGNGTWPAAWLLPQSERYDRKQFPEVTDNSKAWSLNGEIDFMEVVGYLPGEIIPATHSYASMQRGSMYTPGFVTDPYSNYHTYGIIKKPGEIVFTIDGKPYVSRIKQSESILEWPFEQSYYLILNLAIGGDWAGAQGIDAESTSWMMSVRDIVYTPL